MSDETEPTEAEQRHYWRLLWLSSLQAFADTAIQESGWTDAAERNPHFSLVECMCCYFDDAGLASDDCYRRRIARGYLTREEADAVAAFHLVAAGYRSPGGDDYDAEAILQDPAWRNVVKSAQHAQARLLSILDDPQEVAALTKPPVWERMGHGFRATYPDPD